MLGYGKVSGTLETRFQPAAVVGEPAVLATPHTARPLGTTVLVTTTVTLEVEVCLAACVVLVLGLDGRDGDEAVGIVLAGSDEVGRRLGRER